MLVPHKSPNAAKGTAGSFRSWRGLNMWGFMAARLSVAAFELWEATGELNGDLTPHAR